MHTDSCVVANSGAF